MRNTGNLITFFGLCALVLTASAQTVSAPVASVSALSPTKATQVTITTEVNFSDLIPGGVNLQRLDSAGRVESVVGVLRDDGIAPDIVAGDKVFTATALFNEPLGAEKVILRASVARKGVLQRTASAVLTIAVLPVNVPSESAAPNLDLKVTDTLTGSVYIADRVNVCFTDTVNLPTVQAIVSSVGATLIGNFLSLGNCWQLSLGAGSNLVRVRQVMAILNARSDVFFAEEEAIRKPSFVACSVPTCFDASFSRLKLFDAHAITSGEGITMAVLDSGVDWHHAVLNPGGMRIIAGPDTAANPILKTHITDAQGHGTHVAGIMAATAPASKIYAVKVCAKDSNGDLACPASASIEGIRQATALNIKIINISLEDYSGADKMELLAVQAAQKRGGIVVAAAGNRHTSAPSWPAHHAGVLGVGNVDNLDRRSPTSNFSTKADRWVKVAAPGVSINSTVPGGEGTMSGTSQASPFVAGTLALMMSSSGNTPQTSAQANEHVAQLLRTAINIPESASDDRCPEDPCNQGLGAGRISPLAALGAMRITRSTAINAGAVQTIRILITQGSTVLYNSTITTGGQRTGCAIAASPCLVDVPFDFSKLRRGTYTISFTTLESVGSYFATVQLFLPSSSFTAAVSGTASIDSTDPSKAFFSVFAHSTRSASLNLVTGRLTLP